jgi:DNA polymerase-3 subunit chi
LAGITGQNREIQVKACIFHDTSPGQQDRRVFDIAEHVYNQREKVLIYAQNEERAASIDRFLWILRQEAFMPHKIFARNEPDSSVPIAIATSEINPIGAKVLIADGHCSLEFAVSFDTVHEFVNRSSPEIHEACRDRFRAYRARKLPVEHLKE